MNVKLDPQSGRSAHIQGQSLAKRGCHVLVGVWLLGSLTPSFAAESNPSPGALKPPSTAQAEDGLNKELGILLRKAGMTGRIESTLESRLGRQVDPKLAALGRKIFFDPAGGLHKDNACAGCHAPTAGFGDTQSISIGIQNNAFVGPDRRGPRNQRRAPTVVNAAFYPALMLNGRFMAPSGNPFDNSQGFSFPPPEGTGKFPPNDPIVRHLLIAHGHMPFTELNEAAGFTGTKGMIGPRFDQFDDGLGDALPLPDETGTRNEPIRQRVAQRLNASTAYRHLFGQVFPEVKAGGAVTPLMFARAIAEFEFTLVRANAPIDEFARGDKQAMTASEKRGAVLFFGKANCVACHSVAGNSNEMFSDFQNRNIGVPQIAPYFGLGLGDTIFDGPGEDEDHGLAQITGNFGDRYKFRTSPLRNVALQPAFFHNGAYTRLEDAIRHHFDVYASARNYDAKKAGVAADLTHRKAPVDTMLQTVDPLLANPPTLTESEFKDLYQFVKTGLLDPRANAQQFCAESPKKLPSGFRPLNFQGCKQE